MKGSRKECKTVAQNEAVLCLKDAVGSNLTIKEQKRLNLLFSALFKTRTLQQRPRLHNHHLNGSIQERDSTILVDINWVLLKDNL